VLRGLVGADGGAFIAEDCDPDAGFIDQRDVSCPHRCVPWAQLGDLCIDSSGVYAPSCKPGLSACEYLDAGSSVRVCVVPRAEKAPCFSYEACAPGLVCTENTCQKLYGDAGEPCAVYEAFYPLCIGELYCKQGLPDSMGMPPPGTCERRAPLGGTCDGAGTCLTSLRCSSLIGTGTCQRRAGIGEPCSTSVSVYPDCEDGLWCPNATSRCAPIPTDGGDCSYQGTDGVCAPGSYCDNYPTYTCRPLGADGDDCSYNTDCLSNECQLGALRDGGVGKGCSRCRQMADGGP
jgi:hypothetical protein